MPGKGWSFTGKIHQKVCDKPQRRDGRSTRSGLIHQSAAGVHPRERSRERDLSRAGLGHVRKHYAGDALSPTETEALHCRIQRLAADAGAVNAEVVVPISAEVKFPSRVGL
jgi:hypothetical protein